LLKLKCLLKNKEILSKDTFDVDNFDLILEQRDMEDLDCQWMRVLNLLDNESISDEDMILIDSIREFVFKAVYDFTDSSELAGYISDDFEIISKALVTKFNDEWLNAMFNEYLKNKIPCNSLKMSSSNLYNSILFM
jgi:hypothetical protein